jgi:RNA polymerase sigma factor (TIGR02999 family)
MQAAFSPYAEMLRFAHEYIQTDAAGSLTKSHTVMERLVVELYAAEMGKEPRKPLLGEVLADNQFTRRIDRRICARMNAVRDMGNLGSHGEPVQASGARRALDDVCEVLCWYRRRNTGGEIANGRPGADGIAPVADISAEEQADTGAGGVAVATDTARIELIIDAEFDSFNPQRQERVLRAIKELLSAGGDIRVVGKRRGRVRLTLELTPEQAEQLLEAVIAGRLSEVGITDARLVGDEPGIHPRSLRERSLAEDREAADRLPPLVEKKLRRLVQSQMGRMPPGQSMQPTAPLVSSTSTLLLADTPLLLRKLHLENERILVFALARTLRDILLEQARSRAGPNRGGDHQRVELQDDGAPVQPHADNVLALHEALTELETVDPLKAQIVQLRYFVGMTVPETARVLEMTERELHRDWRWIKAWLLNRLGDTAGLE